jgi:hypothetical protein
MGAVQCPQVVGGGPPDKKRSAAGIVEDGLEGVGFHISPDLDSIRYTLTDPIDGGRGWDVRWDSARAWECARPLGPVHRKP